MPLPDLTIRSAVCDEVAVEQLSDQIPVADNVNNRFSERLLAMSLSQLGLTEELFRFETNRHHKFDMPVLSGETGTDTEKWLAQARDEHASVAAFALLQLELLAHGAPLELLNRVLIASQEELEHVAFCKSLAGSSVHLVLPPHELQVRLKKDWPRLLRNSLHDGVEPEGNAALRLWREAYAEHRAGHQIRAQLLWSMGRDEAQHAEIAYDIAQWAATSCGAEAPTVHIGPESISINSHECLNKFIDVAV